MHVALCPRSTRRFLVCPKERLRASAVFITTATGCAPTKATATLAIAEQEEHEELTGRAKASRRREHDLTAMAGLLSAKAGEEAHEDTIVGDDGNLESCAACGGEGLLICCDGCPLAYHEACLGPAAPADAAADDVLAGRRGPRAAGL